MQTTSFDFSGTAGRSSAPSIKEKMAELIPMVTARVMMATALKPRDLASKRKASVRLPIKERIMTRLSELSAGIRTFLLVPCVTRIAGRRSRR